MPPKAKTLTQYLVRIGFDVPTGRYEPGDRVSAADIPAASLPWLCEQGVLEPAEEE